MNSDTDAGSSSSPSNEATPNNTTKQNTSQTVSPYPADGERMLGVLRAIMLFIVRGLHPLSIIDDIHFRKLLLFLDPRIVLPCRKTLTTSLLPNLYEEAKGKLLLELEQCSYVALTSDGWTSSIGDPYITVTVHYVNKKMKMISRVLNTTYMPESHTAEHICKFLKEVAANWKISEKIVCVVTDNAANMIAAVRATGWKNETCFAHSLNLAVKDALEFNNELEQALTQCRNVVTFFKKSPKSYTYLKKLATSANLSTKTLKQEVATRWNSTVIMLRSILALADQIAAGLTFAKRTDLLLDDLALDLLKV